jgi:hypothetical protein
MFEHHPHSIPEKSLKERLESVVKYIDAVSLSLNPIRNRTKKLLLNTLTLVEKFNPKMENWLSVLKGEKLTGSAGIPGIFENNISFKPGVKWYEGHKNPYSDNTLLTLGGFDPGDSDSVNKERLIESSSHYNDKSIYRRVQPLIYSLLENAIETYKTTHYSDITFDKKGVPVFNGIEQFSESKNELILRLVIKNNKNEFGFVDLTLKQIKKLSEGRLNKYLLSELFFGSSIALQKLEDNKIQIKSMDQWFDKQKNGQPPVISFSMIQAGENTPLDQISDPIIPVKVVLNYQEFFQKNKVLNPTYIKTDFSHASSSELPALQFLDKSISRISYVPDHRENFTQLKAKFETEVPFESALLTDELNKKQAALRKESFSNSGARRLSEIVRVSELRHKVEIPKELELVIKEDRKAFDLIVNYYNSLEAGLDKKSALPIWYFLSGLLHSSKIPPYAIVSPNNPRSTTEIEASTYGNILFPIIDRVKKNFYLFNKEKFSDFVSSFEDLSEDIDIFSQAAIHIFNFNEEIRRAREGSGSATLLAGTTGSFRDMLADSTDSIIPEHTALLKGVRQWSDIGSIENKFPELAAVANVEFVGANSKTADFSFSRNGKDLVIKWTLDDSPSWMEIIDPLIKNNSTFAVDKIIKNIIKNRKRYDKKISDKAIMWLTSLLSSQENQYDVIGYDKTTNFKGIIDLLDASGKDGKVRSFAVDFSDCIVDAYVDYLENLKPNRDLYQSNYTQLKSMAINNLEKTSLDSLVTTSIFSYHLLCCHRYQLMRDKIKSKLHQKPKTNKEGPDFSEERYKALKIITRYRGKELENIDEILHEAIDEAVDFDALLIEFSIPDSELFTWINEKTAVINKLSQTIVQNQHYRALQYPY